MLRNLWNKMRCLFGYHDFHEAYYEDGRHAYCYPEERAHIELTCKRCWYRKRLPVACKGCGAVYCDIAIRAGVYVVCPRDSMTKSSCGARQGVLVATCNDGIHTAARLREWAEEDPTVVYRLESRSLFYIGGRGIKGDRSC